MTSSEFSTIQEFVEPVRQRLKEFAPEQTYDLDQIEFAIQKIMKGARIPGTSLDAAQKKIHPALKDEKSRKLLIACATEVFVERAIEVMQRQKKRIPKHQKVFAFELSNEIYTMENGDMCW